jgi:hypothetical protein
MALKLQGIEPRPAGQRRMLATTTTTPPRRPAVEVEGLPTDSAELIKIWRPQACLKAQLGGSEFAIARFLQSKGVDSAAAKAAANDIVSHPAPAPHGAARLRRALGWTFLGLGLLIPIAFVGAGFAGIWALFAALMAAALGSKLLWEPSEKD